MHEIQDHKVAPAGKLAPTRERDGQSKAQGTCTSKLPIGCVAARVHEIQDHRVAPAQVFFGGFFVCVWGC